jgi:DNA-binding CsgD family transcriptional regulator
MNKETELGIKKLHALEDEIGARAVGELDTYDPRLVEIRKLFTAGRELTKRQKQVADLYNAGNSVKKIAEMLHMATNKVNEHVRNARARGGLTKWQQVEYHIGSKYGTMPELAESLGISTEALYCRAKRGAVPMKRTGRMVLRKERRV